MTVKELKGYLEKVDDDREISLRVRKKQDGESVTLYAALEHVVLYLSSDEVGLRGEVYIPG